MNKIKRRLSAISGDSSTGNVGKPRNRRGGLNAFHLRKSNVSKNLLAAANTGDATDIQKMLESGADLAELDTTDKAVRIACEKGHLDVLATLIRFGAAINSFGDESTAPLHVAARHGAVSVIRLLISNGANINILSKFDKRSPLHLAAHAGREESIKVLMEGDSRIKLDITDIYGSTPLHMAARMGHARIVNTFLSFKKLVDVNSYDHEGWTAMHLAAERGDLKMAQLLLDHHAQVDCQNKYGRTPLHWATIKGHSDMVRLLMVYKASTTLRDLHNKCSLNYAQGTAITQILHASPSADFKLHHTPTESTIGKFVRIEARGSFVRRLTEPLPDTIKSVASVKKRKPTAVVTDVDEVDNLDTIAEECSSRRSSSASSSGRSTDNTSEIQPFINDDCVSSKGSLLRSLFARKPSTETSVSSVASRHSSFRSNQSDRDDVSQTSSVTPSRLNDPIDLAVSIDLLTIPSINGERTPSPRQSPSQSRKTSTASQMRNDINDNDVSNNLIDIPAEAAIGRVQLKNLLSKIERHHAAIETIVKSVCGEVSQAAIGRRKLNNEDLNNISSRMRKIQDIMFNFNEDVNQQAKLLQGTMVAFMDMIKFRLSDRDVLPVCLYHAFFTSVVTCLSEKSHGHTHIIQKMTAISEEKRSDILQILTKSDTHAIHKCSQSVYFALDGMLEDQRDTPLRGILHLLIKSYDEIMSSTIVKKFVSIANPGHKSSLTNQNLLILSYRLGNEGEALANHLKVPRDHIVNPTSFQQPNNELNMEILSKWRQLRSSQSDVDCICQLVECLILIGREDLLLWILPNQRQNVDIDESVC